MEGIEEACHREIVDLHRFFEAWFRGEMSPGQAGFARFRRAMAERFLLVTADGERRDLASLTDELFAAHGNYLVSSPPFRIRLRDVEIRAAAPDCAVATYEEWHDVFGASRGRLCTAVFRASEAAPNGVEWLHLHETRLA